MKNTFPVCKSRLIVVFIITFSCLIEVVFVEILKEQHYIIAVLFLVAIPLFLLVNVSKWLGRIIVIIGTAYSLYKLITLPEGSSTLSVLGKLNVALPALLPFYFAISIVIVLFYSFVRKSTVDK